jgi:prepilin-type N-terminal cleavage/methylation domain-containing protein
MRRAESGFTIIELLMAIAILGIVLGTVGLSVTQGFRHTTTTRARVDRSNLAEFTAKSFGPDVASASAIPVVYTAPATSACGPGAVVTVPRAGGESIDYAVVADGADTVLVRRRCSGATVLGSRTIGRTNVAFSAVATCLPSVAVCRTVTLTVTWTGAEPTTFTLRAERRAA